MTHTSCLTILNLISVLIEEAAEILESHIVAALTPHTQHLILIGDHKQLRPTTSVYKIAKEYKMNISLFERMVNNGINSTRLAIQHRMRPEISRLVRATTYPDLEDSESVQKYPSVKGMMNNLFFIDHNHLESKVYYFKNPFFLHFNENINYFSPKMILVKRIHMNHSIY